MHVNFSIAGGHGDCAWLKQVRRVDFVAYSASQLVNKAAIRSVRLGAESCDRRCGGWVSETAVQSLNFNATTQIYFICQARYLKKVLHIHNVSRCRDLTRLKEALKHRVGFWNTGNRICLLLVVPFALLELEHRLDRCSRLCPSIPFGRAENQVSSLIEPVLNREFEADVGHRAHDVRS